MFVHTRAPGSRIKKWDFMQLLIQENGPIAEQKNPSYQYRTFDQTLL
jgi:hypothetical protein